MTMQQRTRRVLATGGVLGALTIGAALPALAQDPAEQTTEDTTEDTTEETTREERGAAERGEFAAALAEELGLDAATVDAALESVWTELAEEREAEHRAALEDRLAEAVEAGDLTQEQADALLAAAEAGVLGGGRGGMGGPGMGGPGMRHGGPGHGGPGMGGFGGPGDSGGEPPADVRTDDDSSDAPADETEAEPTGTV